ncbi:MAG: hypothetical protein M1832_006246 [Thelocarpon impressellum]|nr:MAG: hypothetical protein M1832_006246 [Thelocarpon impressellum]
MSSLDLKVEDITGHTVIEKTFDLLRDFLQPDTALSMGSTARSILDFLPETAPHSIEGEVAGHNLRFQRLKESFSDALNVSDPEDPGKYVNLHAFAANLHERRILPTNPAWAIRAHSEAHEGGAQGQDGMRATYVLAAAQWILWYGQSLFKQVLFSGDVTSDDLRAWTPGPLYHGAAHLTLQRWHFWKDGFRAAAAEGNEEEKGLGQECSTVAAKAAELMESLEESMAF